MRSDLGKAVKTALSKPIDWEKKFNEVMQLLEKERRISAGLKARNTVLENEIIKLKKK